MTDALLNGLVEWLHERGYFASRAKGGNTWYAPAKKPPEHWYVKFVFKGLAHFEQIDIEVHAADEGWIVTTPRLSFQRITVPYEESLDKVLMVAERLLESKYRTSRV